MNKVFVIIVSFFACVNTLAQISTNERPVSFGFMQKLASSASTVTMPILNMEKIEAEDEENAEYDMPLRFGYPYKVDYNLVNSGTWMVLPNGDRLWQLNVVCPGALSVNFCYDKFWIPEGGKLFVYSTDQKHFIGAFTSRNNKGDREHVRGFATGLVYGSNVTLEYYQPKEVTEDAIISIDYIVHGYRYINFDEEKIGGAGSCMVNVNCEEGRGWQYEKNAVARIIIEGAYYCSGSLIATTNLTGEPFFLTANHCISRVGDAIGDANLDYTFFYWNYEASGCTNTSVDPILQSTSGATILANGEPSDFALLRLTEDPVELVGYTPYYLGWDYSGQSGDAGVCIHHPKGDTKKISTVASQPVSTSYVPRKQNTNDNSHWRVNWKETLNGHGTTEGGSSGAPLISSVHRVIGQLHGGYANCVDSINGSDWYGKFSVSWMGNGNNSVYRRLNCWLDSINAGVLTMEGLLIIPDSIIMATDEQLYCNMRITSSGQLTIQGDIELMGNSRVVIEPGGQLIIDGGALSNVELDMRPGSTLRIINDGLIETRNGFTAPIGAIVEINHGQIL